MTDINAAYAAGLRNSLSKAGQKADDVSQAATNKQVQLSGEYASTEQYDLLNPMVAPSERLRAHGEINLKNAQAGFGRTTGEFLSDTGIALGKTLATLPLDIASGTVDVALDPAGTVVSGTKTIAQGTAELVGKREQFDEDTASGFGAVESFLSDVERSFPSELSFVKDVPQDIAHYLRKGSGAVKEFAEDLTSDRLDLVRDVRRAKTAEENILTEATEEGTREFLGQYVPAEVASPAVAAKTNLEKLWNTLTNFGLGEATSAAIESAPYLVTAGKSAQAAKTKVTQKGMAAGPQTKAAVKATEAKAEKAAAQAATVSVGVMEGTANASEVYSEVIETSHEDLSANSPMYTDLLEQGSTPEEARKTVASRAAKAVVASTGIVAGLANILTGGVAEKVISKAAAPTGVAAAKRVAASAVTEAPEEYIQSGAGKLAQNIALQSTADETQETFEGVEQAASEGAVTGALAAGITTASGEAVPLTRDAAKGVTKHILTPAAKTTFGKLATKYQTKAEARRAAAAEEEVPVSEPVETPVKDYGDELDKVVAEAPETVSDASQGIKDKVTSLQQQVAEINQSFTDVPTEELNVPELLVTASMAEAASADLATDIAKTLQDDTLSSEERQYLTKLSEQVTSPGSASITGKLAQQIKTLPALRVSLDTAFKAATSGDVEPLTNMVSAIEQVGKTEEVKERLVNTLLQTTLYSVDLLSDPDVSVDQLQKAAELSSGSVSKQYSALATIKDMDAVAAEVIDGKREFVGINRRLTDLRDQIAANEDTSGTVERIASFAKQRTRKANAIEEGLADISAGNVPAGTSTTVTYGNKEADRFVIHNTPKGIPAATAVLEQIRKEEQLVQNALSAASTLIQGDTVSSAEETTTDFIKTTTDNVELKGTPVTDTEITTERDIAITEATELVDLQVQELTTAIPIMERTLAAQNRIAERTGTVSAYAQADDAKERLDAATKQLEELRDRKVTEAARAAKQYDLEQMDWKLSVDSSLAATPTKQLASLVASVLGTISGKAAKKAINTEYATQLDTAKQIASYVRELSAKQLEGILTFVEGLSLSVSDTAAVTTLLGASRAITTAPNSLKNTLANLRSVYTEVDLGMANANRFKNSVISYTASKFWEDTNYLEELSVLSTVSADGDIAQEMASLGLDTTKLNEHDYQAIRNLQAKRTWFDEEFLKLNETLVDTLKTAKPNIFDQNALRFLLEDSGYFSRKMVDAAFMAYTNGTYEITESRFNDNKTLMSVLGLSDESLLMDLPNLQELRSLGTSLNGNQFANEFRKTLGIQHTRDLPLSVTDSVYSAMGGMLFNLLKSDPDVSTTSTYTPGFGSVTGFTLTEPAEVANFTALKNQGTKVLSQLSEGINTAPDNWVGTLPPKAVLSDTHIGSNDQLTPEEVDAENIYRSVKHRIDPLIESLHNSIGLEGYKLLKGFDANTDSLNVEHRLSVEGKNQEILDAYSKADKLVKQVAASDNKDIYFENAFSSVRRQQQRGAVNPQGNKYHRILVGHKNTAKLKKINLNNLIGLKVGSNNYNFVLAMGQALGVDVDKQANHISFKQTVTKLQDAIAAEASGVGLYAQLTDQMDASGNLVGELAPDTLNLLRDVTKGVDHHIQGVLTLAKLIRTSSEGVTSNFTHYMRAEIDGLTNGPAHSTIMGGLAGLAQDEVEDKLSKGGYLKGSGDIDNTHTQIGRGTITDFYLTVSAQANRYLGDHLQVLRSAIAGKDPELSVKDAELIMRKYTFLGDRGLAIAGEYAGEGTNRKLTNLEVTRSGTKNPVTVTVYGGGASGIHRKMSSELLDLFAQELTSLASGQYKRSEIVKALEGWSELLYGRKYLTGKKSPLKVLTDVRAAKDSASLRNALLNFGFDAQLKDTAQYVVKSLYGDVITNAINSVFSPNKRSATLMNAGVNFVTAIANDTFEKAYVSLTAKRVEEGTIRGITDAEGKFVRAYDTLPAKDVGLIQRKIEEVFPYLTTAIEDTTDISKKSKERLAQVGVEEVRHPTVGGGESSPEISHSTRGLALPGVRAIPVLTISIDGSTQIKNHLLQGASGKYLNVLDAIDRVADNELRASNEVFNAAEFISLMGTDTIGSVQKAVVAALAAQNEAITIEGIEVTPTLKELNDNLELTGPDARLTLAQENLRQALQDMTSPITKEFGISAKDVGNINAFLEYLTEQLEVERNNNQLVRDNYVFGSGEIAINQMAGIDGGHASVVNGQLVLSDAAKKLIGDSGNALVASFNNKMSTDYSDYMARTEEDLRPKEDTELEELRKTIELVPDSVEARAEVKNILNPLTGLWQDLRSTFDKSTNSLVYKLTGANLPIFKNIINPTVTQEFADSASLFGVESSIPSVGNVLTDLLGARDSKNRDYLDTILEKLEVHLTSELPDGMRGSYQRLPNGKHIISLRIGLSTVEANEVLAHELIHAVTSEGIALGISGKNALARQLSGDLWKQMGRMVRIISKSTNAPASYSTLVDLYTAAAKDNNPEAIALALNEYVAIVGSEKLSYKEFLDTRVAKTALSNSLRNLITQSWATLKKYLTDTFGRKPGVTPQIQALTTLNKASVREEDVLAQIFEGLGSVFLSNMDSTKTGKRVMYSADYGTSEGLTAAQNYMKHLEGQSDKFMRKGLNLTTEAILRSIGKLPIRFAERATSLAELSPEERSETVNVGLDRVLTGTGEGTRLEVLRSTFGEFFSRDSVRSRALDEHADKAKHSIDSERESKKVIASQGINEALGDISPYAHASLLKVVLRGDLFALGGDITRLVSLVTNPTSVRNGIRESIGRIRSIQGASEAQKTLMINEALALGARSVTGGSYEGFNLPNAKAIVNMSGTSFSAVTKNADAYIAAVDELATLEGLRHSTPDERTAIAELLTSNPEGVNYVVNKHRTIQEKVIEQYGQGKEFTIPKGYVPDQVNPNRAIKVVPWRDRNKYPDFIFKREFIREASDIAKGEKMALLVSSEGGNTSYVQGAMSTIESAIGGFTTTYGSATDKALPSYTETAEVKAINANRAKLSRRYSSQVVFPKELSEGMVPHVNSTGKVIGYRYVLSNQERHSYLETHTDVSEVLATYDARMGEQVIAEDFNRELVAQLHTAYTESDNKDEFVQVGATVEDDELVQIWRVIPQHTKKVIRETFGDNHVYVHKRDLDNALGYREWSISNLWRKNLEPGSKSAIFVDIAETILGDNALNKLRWAERALQEGVVMAKDLIVVKSIVVPVANAVSNTNHLIMRGVDPIQAVKDVRTSWNGLQSYKSDHKALLAARERRDIAGEALDELIHTLEQKIQNNPISFMVEQGLLPTVVEDIDRVNLEGTVKQGILDSVLPSRVTKTLGSTDNRLLDIGKNIIITQDSVTYKHLSNLVEAGDFCAKFVLYNHLRNVEGKSQQEALDEIRVEYVNYNTLTNKQLDYLNKVGGIFFFKYFFRIQPIIFNTIKNNPTRALTTWIGADTANMPSIFDAMWLGKDITYTTGAYDLLQMAGGAHPYFGD